MSKRVRKGDAPGIVGAQAFVREQVVRVGSARTSDAWVGYMAGAASEGAEPSTSELLSLLMAGEYALDLSALVLGRLGRLTYGIAHVRDGNIHMSSRERLLSYYQYGGSKATSLGFARSGNQSPLGLGPGLVVGGFEDLDTTAARIYEGKTFVDLRFTNFGSAKSDGYKVLSGFLNRLATGSETDQVKTPVAHVNFPGNIGDIPEGQGSAERIRLSVGLSRHRHNQRIPVLAAAISTASEAGWQLDHQETAVIPEWRPVYVPPEGGTPGSDSNTEPRAGRDYALVFGSSPAPGLLAGILSFVADAVAPTVNGDTQGSVVGLSHIDLDGVAFTVVILSGVELGQVERARQDTENVRLPFVIRNVVDLNPSEPAAEQAGHFEIPVWVSWVMPNVPGCAVELARRCESLVAERCWSCLEPACSKHGRLRAGLGYAVGRRGLDGSSAVGRFRFMLSAENPQGAPEPHHKDAFLAHLAAGLKPLMESWGRTGRVSVSLTEPTDPDWRQLLSSRV